MRSGGGKGLEEVVFGGGEVETGVKGGAKRRAVEECGSGGEMRVIRRKDRGEGSSWKRYRAGGAMGREKSVV